MLPQLLAPLAQQLWEEQRQATALDAAKALQVSGMDAARFVISLKQRAMAEEAYSGGAIEALLQADLYPSNLQPERSRAPPSRVRAALAAAREGMWFEGWLQGLGKAAAES